MSELAVPIKLRVFVVANCYEDSLRTLAEPLKLRLPQKTVAW